MWIGCARYYEGSVGSASFGKGTSSPSQPPPRYDEGRDGAGWGCAVARWQNLGWARRCFSITWGCTVARLRLGEGRCLLLCEVGLRLGLSVLGALLFHYAGLHCGLAGQGRCLTLCRLGMVAWLRLGKGRCLLLAGLRCVGLCCAGLAGLGALGRGLLGGDWCPLFDAEGV